MSVENPIKKDTVFIIVPHLAGGGQERIAAVTADLLMSYYNVKLIIFSANKNVYSTKAEIINLNVLSERNVVLKIYQQSKRILKLRKLKHEYKPRINYSIGNTANITNVFSGGPGKNIVSLRGYANIRKNLIDKLVYNLADGITCISKTMMVKLSKLFPNISNKVEVLYNGIDIDRIENQIEISQVMNPLPENKKIVSVGRLTDVKGFRQLILSFNELLKIEKNVSLIIIGEGENRQPLEDLIQQLGIEKHVFLLGFKHNVYAYIEECDLFVLSSINEGFGNVIVEAMACGLPVVSTACLAGPAEILGSETYDIQDIRYCEFGVLVPSFVSDISFEVNKTSSLTQAMYEMITNEEIINFYKKQSLIRAKDFSLTRYEKKILDYFSQF